MTERARTALRFGGWANVALGIFHLVGLLFAWTFFRWTSIEPEMRELSDTNTAFPYLLTVFVAGAFVVFGLYAFSAAGDFRPLPFVRVGVAIVALGYFIRGLAGVPDGVAAGIVRGALDTDLREVLFSTAALAIASCYAYGAWALGARETPLEREPAAV